MPYRIELSDAAKLDLRALRKSGQVKVLDKIEMHLTYQPTDHAEQEQNQVAETRNVSTLPPPSGRTSSLL